MYNLPNNATLYKIHEFRIENTGGAYIRLEVSEYLNPLQPSLKNLFHAAPVDWPFRLKQPKKQYIFSGSTLTESLNALLAAIEGVQNVDLFENKESK